MRGNLFINLLSLSIIIISITNFSLGNTEFNIRFITLEKIKNDINLYSKTFLELNKKQNNYPKNNTIESDLIGCWHFDENSGNITYDSSGNNNHGKIYGASRTNGINNNGLKFDGQNDYVIINDTPTLQFHNINELSIEVWIKWNGTIIKNNNQTIIDKEDYGGFNLVLIDNGSKIKFRIENEKLTSDLISNYKLNTEWHQIVCTWDGLNQSIFLDGILDISKKITNFIISDYPKPLEIGNHLGYNNDINTYNGIIDEISIYNRALKSDEVLIHYQKYMIPDIVHVDDNYDVSTIGWGYDCFNNIQDGINAVSKGGIVYVYNGIYFENIIINKTINLTGNNKDTAIIDGGGLGDVVQIKKNNVNISDLTIRNSGYKKNFKIFSGININTSSRIQIKNNIISNNYGIGIYTINSNECNFIENTLVNNKKDGITLINSSKNNVYKNFIRNNWENDISFYNSVDNIIEKNFIESSYFNGIIISSSIKTKIINNEILCDGYNGINLQFSSQNSIYKNKVKTKANCAISIQFQSNKNNITKNNITSYVESNSNGIYFFDSNQNKIKFNNITGCYNGFGLSFFSSSNNTIKQNNIINNFRGIFFKKSCTNIIQNNNISKSRSFGIDFETSCFNNISNNLIIYNQDDGIHLSDYSDKSLIINNIIKSNLGDGIYTIFCFDNKFINNHIMENFDNGIHLNESFLSKIKNNLIINNYKHGINVYHLDFKIDSNIISNNTFINNGFFIKNSYKNIVKDNIINEKILLYLEDEMNLILKNEDYGEIMLVSCDNITICNQVFENTSIGIELQFSYNCLIYNNDFLNNQKGIYLHYSSLNHITKNNFIENEIDANYLLWKDDPYIIPNKWHNNYWNDKTILPLPIYGQRSIHILDIWWKNIPSVSFDWNPARKPYNINDNII
jgi:parallel beta-helix repeat protein